MNQFICMGVDVMLYNNMICCSASNIALMQLLEQIDMLFDAYANEMTNLIE